MNVSSLIILTTTVKPVFKSTWEIGTTWELRTATLVPVSIRHTEMDLRNKTTAEFRTVLDSPLGVPNSQVPLYFLFHAKGSLHLRIQMFFLQKMTPDTQDYLIDLYACLLAKSSRNFGILTKYHKMPPHPLYIVHGSSYGRHYFWWQELS